MAEQTFRSPGFFDREIELVARQKAPSGTPAGVIGTSQRGPAFVPVIVGSFADWVSRFGNLDHKKFGPYAVNEFLKNIGTGHLPLGPESRTFRTFVSRSPKSKKTS